MSRLAIKKYPGLFIVVFSLFVLTGFRYSKNKERDITFFIKPVFAGKDIVLEKGKYITANNDTVSIDRFRFYLSAFELKFENGTSYKEKNSYHLVDAEDSVSLKIVLKNVPEGKITDLKFCIGVDSLASVSGALDGDLDPAKGMYWAWNSGYINAKLEGKSTACAAVHSVFEFHIGGYLPKEKTIQTTRLALKDQINETGNASVTLLSDAAAWFKEIDLSKTNSIVIPGEEAVKMANNYSHMFTTGK